METLWHLTPGLPETRRVNFKPYVAFPVAEVLGNY
jgi:hypothetical protein